MSLALGVTSQGQKHAQKHWDGSEISQVSEWAMKPLKMTKQTATFDRLVLLDTIGIILYLKALNLSQVSHSKSKKDQPCGTVIIFFYRQSCIKPFIDIFIVPAEPYAFTVTFFSIFTTNFELFSYGSFWIEWTLFPFEPFCTRSSTNCWICVLHPC